MRPARNGWSVLPHWVCSPRRSRRRNRSGSARWPRLGSASVRYPSSWAASSIRARVVLAVTTSCSLAMIDRSRSSSMAAIGQPDLAEHGIDRSAGYRPQSARDLHQQRRHQCPGRARTSLTLPARQRRVDRWRDQDGRLAPSPAGYQSDTPVLADELQAPRSAEQRSAASGRVIKRHGEGRR